MDLTGRRVMSPGGETSWNPPPLDHGVSPASSPTSITTRRLPLKCSIGLALASTSNPLNGILRLWFRYKFAEIQEVAPERDIALAVFRQWSGSIATGSIRRLASDWADSIEYGANPTLSRDGRVHQNQQAPKGGTGEILTRLPPPFPPNLGSVR